MIDSFLQIKLFEVDYFLPCLQIHEQKMNDLVFIVDFNKNLNFIVAILPPLCANIQGVQKC